MHGAIEAFEVDGDVEELAETLRLTAEYTRARNQRLESVSDSDEDEGEDDTLDLRVCAFV